MVAPAGSGVQDTYLRTGDATTGRPLLYGAQNHPYLEAELPRKIANNTTTVSNVFCVYVTIVYHEVRMDTSGATPTPMGESVDVETDADTTTAKARITRHFLGREAFREVPGDMRQQYLALVDRSSAVVPAGDQNRTDRALLKTPYYAALGQAVNAGDTSLTLANSKGNGTASVIIYSDGKLIEIKDNEKLLVGTGPEAEIVTVSTVNNGTINLSGTGFVRPHAGGVVVTNASTGRPEQPGSNFNPIVSPDPFRRDGYPFLIPYAGRVR